MNPRRVKASSGNPPSMTMTFPRRLWKTYELPMVFLCEGICHMVKLEGFLEFHWREMSFSAALAVRVGNAIPAAASADDCRNLRREICELACLSVSICM